MLRQNCIVVVILFALGTATCFGNQSPANGREGQAVVSFTAPQGEKLSADYTLRVNGKNVPVYSCRVSAAPINQVWPGYQRPLVQTELASFAYWAMSGPVTVEISSNRPYQSVAVRPASRGITPKTNGRLITFQLLNPQQLTVELDGTHFALHLFADPPETGAPKAGDPNVLYFGPGVHRPGKIELRSGQTVYVAAGSVVYTTIEGHDLTGVSILGRGIIDESEFSRGQGGAIHLTNSTGVTIDGVILRDPAEWGLACFGCRDVTISRVKEIGFWRYNSDGIDICNSQDVTIRDSFVRSFDDSIVIKGLKIEENSIGDRPERHIRVSNLVLWCDWGRALEVGAETSTPEISDVVFSNIDIVRTSFVAMDIQHGDRAAVHGIHFENIRVEVDDVSPQPVYQTARDEKYAPDPSVAYIPQLFVIVIQPTMWSKDKAAGTVRDVTLKDISVTGKPQPSSSVTGYDAEHDVQGVSIDNLRFNGRPATDAEAAHLKVNSFAEPVHFVAGAQTARDALIGIQYEHWFYGPESWKTAEAIPLLGKYTTDEPTVASHYAQFNELGIDWLLIDWTNMLWMKPDWEQHAGDTARLEEKTAVLFKTALDLHRQGKYSPKLVFMLGLQNGPPVPNGVQRLNGILAWLKKNYLDQPQYKDLWLYEDGKPLLTVLYVAPDPCAQIPKDLAAAPLHTENWTLRWMGTQLQDEHGERCGMWSWMDGVIPQVLTKRDGKAEEIVVTPASFVLPGNGWTAPTAIARDHGVPYLESWKAAFAARPRFIQIHQWNEFAGQEDGQGVAPDYWGQQPASATPAKPSDIYYDEYSLQLSDDIEPTDLHACSLRGCGGWGYYYFNLTRAIIALYRGVTPDITVLALSGPQAPVDSSVRSIDFHWSYLGKAPTSYTISLDGKAVASSLQGSTYSLDLSRVAPGTHRVQLTAHGVNTVFALDATRPTFQSAKPLPVESEVSFDYIAHAKVN